MSDLRALLHDAAPAPSRPLDVDALVAIAARRRPWRRTALWLGGISVIAGLGAGATGVLTPAGHPTLVDTTPAKVHLPISERQGHLVAASAPEASATGQPTASQRATQLTTDRAIASESSGNDAEGCYLRTGGAGWFHQGVGGVGYDNMDDTCSYKAAHRGGYHAAGAWTLTIRRKGVDTTYSYALHSASCAAIGFIHPGDIVTVTVRTGGAATPDAEIEAGPEVSCSS